MSLRSSRLSVVVLLAAAAAGCGGPPAPAAPEPARPVTTLDDAEIALVADLIRLEDTRAFDGTALEAAMRHDHPELRRRAAATAGRLRDADAVPLLLRALGDSAGAVRAEAAFALGQLGDTAAQVLQALIGHAADTAESPDVRIEAVAALGKLRAGAGRPAVEAILASPDSATPPAVADEAVLAVWRFPRQVGAAALLRPHLRSNDAGRRWRAAYALMRIGDPAAVPLLLDGLTDTDYRVRQYAARSLRAGLADSAAQGGPAADALAAAAADPHAQVRINALRALATYRRPDLAPIVEKHLHDADRNVAIAAAEALGGLGGAGAADALETAVRDPGALLALRGAALTALARIAPERAGELADPFVASPVWLDRLYAARSLRSIPWNVAAPGLRRLAADPDPRVAAAALGSLVEVAGDSVPGLLPLLVERLGSTDPGIRTAAIQGIGRLAGAGELAVLLEAYQRAAQDSGTNDAALAAVAALGRLAEQGVPVARSFFLRFRRSADPIVRRDVYRVLGAGSWGNPLPVETGRSVAFYRALVRRLVAPSLAGDDAPALRIHTAGGTIVVALAAADAPLTVHAITELARRGYFNGLRWHRVVPNFVLQGGDPRGDGSGGPGYAIRDEVNRIRYGRGVVGMALSGPDTGGSQFFITHSPQPHLDGGYTVFGRVIQGMDVVDRVVQDDLIESIELLP